MFKYSTRVKLAIAFIVLVVLTSTFRQLRSILSSFRALPQTDDISQYERRFTDVKQFLPPNQIVSYIDEFAKLSGQCKTFALAQYSLTPTVLAVLDSGCGHMADTHLVSSQRSRFVLENSYDPEYEPYLLRLFPFQPINNPGTFIEGYPSHADQTVLVKDFGRGVRLYSRADK